MNVCAIDFGTSNSAVAVVQNGVIRVAGSGSSGKKTMPSLIYFSEDGGYAVGEEAITAYLANTGRGRLVQSIKTFLPDKGFDQTNVYGKFYTLVDFIAIILKALKSRAEKLADQEVSDVVLGRPVRFSAKEDEDRLAEKRLLEAAKKVGFKNIGIQMEPIAAALGYESSLDKEQLVLVGDFGGGTSDFTIMKLSPTRSHLVDRRGDILGTAGINIAGDAFDSQIMWEKLMHYFGRGVVYESSAARDRMIEFPTHILRTLCEWHKIPFLNTRQHRNYIEHVKFNSTDPEAMNRLKNIIEHNLGFNIFQAIGIGKSKLSSAENSSIRVINNYFEIVKRITRTELGEIIKVELQKIMECYLDLLQKAGINKQNIQAVFLTGGTSNLPHIRQMFIDEFGEEKVRRQGKGFTSVVHGLALSAQKQFI
ncbi:MAG TPA: Hsp70 family protein [bacterium]|nr:Hsp70 family protein [bacterium]HPL95397.1 Hsp70 family protein [bacterium]